MNTEMTIKKLPVSMLKPAKYNPRKDLKPGDPAYEKIKRSLRDFGYVDPVIWNEVTGNIVGGHQRYKVLTAEGATEIDCVVVHIENPNDEKALNVALNKAVGEWEPKALADLLSDLQLAGYDVGATGFDAAEIDDLFSKVHDKDVKDDDTKLDPETITPFVRSGDLWTLGKHKMLFGDATKPEDLDALMGDVRANLIVTDPHPTTSRMNPPTASPSRTTAYSGIIGRASINFYAFNTNGNKSIACGLNNIQKLRDGTPLGGHSRAEDDFAGLDDDDEDFLS